MTRTIEIPRVPLPGGETVSALGQGTWMMAERSRQRADEIAALQAGVDLGMTLIDTAEMYADGGAETLVGEALGHRREEIFLVSKVMPQNASRRGTIAACDASLRRLGTDRIDLYLLHWRGRHPLHETIEAFNALKRDGKIRYWGVSNFDVNDMGDLATSTASSGSTPATNQVLYNLMRRGIEHDLLPWCRARGVPVMAYSPLEQGKLLKNTALTALGARLQKSPAQVALSWVVRQPDIIAIPKAGTIAHVRNNYEALSIVMSPSDLNDLDRAFPPPSRKTPLEMI